MPVEWHVYIKTYRSVSCHGTSSLSPTHIGAPALMRCRDLAFHQRWSVDSNTKRTSPVVLSVFLSCDRSLSSVMVVFLEISASPFAESRLD